ncbi:MAG: PAS domain S-box protein [Rhodoferax sp.]|uniref:PAS domain-containing sensor histidine kinase n=1 Tax=Rhodoferax sp. TaxID=50421 RepID=UPI0030186FF1
MFFNRLINALRLKDLHPAASLKNWWHRLSPHSQDRFAALAPLAAVLLFLAAIVAAFGYLRLEEIDREHEAVQRDVEYTHQRLRLRLLERQEQLMLIAREIINHELDVDEFQSRAEAMINQYPEMQGLTWIDERKRIKANYGSASLSPNQIRTVGSTLKLDETESNYSLTRELQQPIYSQSMAAADTPATLQLHIPLIDRAGFSGVLLAEYSVDGLFRYGVPAEVSARYAISFHDANQGLLAGTSIPTRKRNLLPWDRAANIYQVPVSPVGNGLVIQGQAYRTSLGVIGSALFWLVVVLSTMTAWMLIANWRHSRRRLQTQHALESETVFRRAMENSMLTGMRALDLQGRITYVNAAFCQMTGWSENDLVGRVAPFPYWPQDDRDLLTSRLEEELSGKTLAGGIQMRVKRQDGTLFDARLYVSPLIDARGLHTGWMTSMTDITEPNRIREQLSASHERFTTVLEALDASISVAPLGSDELLFANKLYRLWFGTQAGGHLQLAAQAGVPAPAHSDEPLDNVDAYAGLPANALAESEAESAEVYLEPLGKWLEVRTRYLSWVDGRLAQMVIASDITARRVAEKQSAAQTERAQTASRLITMGEMASSVAHELNQPLTAINNYCNGMVSRIKSKQITEEDLLGALEKTAKQAHRAGQIIQRIRSFVKRSEPNRTLSEISNMVDEAVELAEIELRRRNVRLTYYAAPRMAALMVDPILIEQVLVNLLKNAAESIDSAQRPTALRNVKLRVVPKLVDDKPVIEFTVTDTGPGLAPEVLARLYEAFYSTKADGMGIGLSLCRSIVESHMGRMKAENLYNGAELTGCCFSFWIPVTEILPLAAQPVELQPRTPE